MKIDIKKVQDMISGLVDEYMKQVKNTDNDYTKAYLEGCIFGLSRLSIFLYSCFIEEMVNDLTNEVKDVVKND